MSRYAQLRALRSGCRPNLPNPLVGPQPILYGTDGFLTYCTLCNVKVGPLRATLAAALVDRINHNRQESHQ